MATIDPGIVEQFAPCPFCKEKIQVNVNTPYEDSDELHIDLSCTNCDVVIFNTSSEMNKHADPESLLEWWNMINQYNGHGQKEEEIKLCKHWYNIDPKNLDQPVQNRCNHPDAGKW